MGRDIGKNSSAAQQQGKKYALSCRRANRCVGQAGFSEVSPAVPARDAHTQVFCFSYLHLIFFGGFFLVLFSCRETVRRHQSIYALISLPLTFVTALFANVLHRRFTSLQKEMLKEKFEENTIALVCQELLSSEKTSKTR